MAISLEVSIINPGKITDAIIDALKGAAQSVEKEAENLGEKLMDGLGKKVEEAGASLGEKLLAGLFQAFEAVGDGLWKVIGDPINQGLSSMDALAQENTALVRGSFESLGASILGSLTAMSAGVTDSFIGALEGCKQGIAAVTGALQGAIQGIKVGLAEAIGLVGQLITAFGLAALAASDLAGLIALAGSGGEKEDEGFKFNGILSSLGEIASAIPHPVGQIIGAVLSIYGAIFQFFEETDEGKEIWAGFVSWIEQTLTDFAVFLVTDFVPGVLEAWEGIKQFFSDMYHNYIEPIIQGFIIALLVLGAIFNFLYENFIRPVIDAIVTKWREFYEGNIQPIIEAIKGKLNEAGGAFRRLWDENVQPVVDKLKGGLESLGNTVREIFSGIAGFVGSAFNGLIDKIRGPINTIIDFVNKMIDKINGIKIDIPEIARAFFGGASSFSFDIPKIPKLAKGGIVEAQPGGILANIGEGRYDEAVIPLTPQFMSALAGGGNSGRNVTVEQHITTVQDDPRIQMRQWSREAGRAMSLA